MDIALISGLIGFAVATPIGPGPNSMVLMRSGAVFGVQASGGLA